MYHVYYAEQIFSTDKNTPSIIRLYLVLKLKREKYNTILSSFGSIFERRAKLDQRKIRSIPVSISVLINN